jgi:hypothetical protein
MESHETSRISIPNHYFSNPLSEKTKQSLLTLAQENSMTHQLALSTVKNHIYNERNITFKQKQEKSIVSDYVKQLPNKRKVLIDQDSGKSPQQSTY